MDIALAIIAEGDFACDITLTGADLTGDDGMKTAVLISLFTDARADDDDDLPYAGADRRGWWGDTYAAIPGDVTGSKLWLLERATATPANLSLAQTWAYEALSWMIDDKVASGVTCVASYPLPGWMSLAVSIDRPNGQARLDYDFVWQNS